MGRVCSMYGGKARFIQGIGGGELLERGHLDDLGVDGMIALKCIFKKLDGGH